MRDPRHDILFEPIAIGPRTLPNRFLQTAHCLGAGSDKPGFQAHFRAMKAQGGWGCVSTEYCSISPESDDLPLVSARIWDDGDVANLGLLCDLLHEQGALAAVELYHGGPNAAALESRVPARGASQIPSTFGFMRSCREMDLDDIREVQQQYVDAAIRARAAGFDVITIYCAHTTALPHQFLLPFYNKRTDEYGGSFENRARFTREVVTQVREAVGDELAISVRFGIHTVANNGAQGIRHDDEGHRFLEHMDDLVDLWDIVSEDLENVGPSRFVPENFEQRYNVGVKQHTDKPVINVGRFTNPDTMVSVIASGQADIIGAARPSIADPFLPQKIREGRVDEIRECIGCNICISRWAIGGPPLICTQNATAGEEYRRGWHPERFERAKNADNDVLVIGAGPAGMECATVLGKRGMRTVHLLDAASEPGGCIRTISTLPGLGEWARVSHWRTIQIDKLRNVELIARARLDAEAVLDYGAEIVVVATGAVWAGDGMSGLRHDTIPGADGALEHVLTPDQVFAGKTVADRVVVYDTDGYFMGVGMAQRLAREGRQVTYVSAFDTAAPYTAFTLEQGGINAQLRADGIGVLTGHFVESIAPGGITLRDRFEQTAREHEADSVVLVTQRRSDDALYRELKAQPEALAEAGITGLYQVGDCVLPQLIADVVFSGHRLAREIDSANPAIPLPYIRERAVVGASESRSALTAR
jgi:dimethylamine/trimethylamine dehydrogenase